MAGEKLGWRLGGHPAAPATTHQKVFFQYCEKIILVGAEKSREAQQSSNFCGV
jgi:hypothetical protein